MRNIIIKKENGEVSIVDKNDVKKVNEIIKNSTNPCSECIYGYASKCPKICDNVKKNIGEYDYITDGYQKYDKNGELKNFLIQKCNNFEKQTINRKNKTKEELMELKRLKESIKILYFDGIDIREADRIQYDTQKRLYKNNVEEIYRPIR